MVTRIVLLIAIVAPGDLLAQYSCTQYTPPCYQTAYGASGDGYARCYAACDCSAGAPQGFAYAAAEATAYSCTSPFSLTASANVNYRGGLAEAFSSGSFSSGYFTY